MFTIQYVESWQLVRARIERWNEDCLIGHTYTGAPIYDLKRKLRTSHRDLLFDMIRLYSKQLREYTLLRVGSNLPPFHTNAVALAKVRDCSPVAVRRQLDRLLDAGLIQRKVHGGRKRNFRLYLDPEILVIGRRCSEADLAGLEQKEREIDNQAIEGAMLSTLPQLKTRTKNKKNKPGNVDSRSGENEGLKTSSDFTGNTPLQEEGKDTPLQDRVDGVGEDFSARPAPGPHLSPKDRQRLDDYYMRLFALIVAGLYNRLEYMAASQAFEIKKFIAGEFYTEPPGEWEEIYQRLRIRVMIAAEWLDRDPNRFIPIPGVYFAPDNENGFERTRRWYGQIAENRGKIQTYTARYQTMMKAWAGFVTVVGEHLKKPGVHGYMSGRKKVEEKYQNLVRAYDYVFLSLLHEKMRP
ncbi:MAG: MarR family winged helix-turn-helix transcriptional regulator [Bacteroidota bacterium]